MLFILNVHKSMSYYKEFSNKNPALKCAKLLILTKALSCQKLDRIKSHKLL